jgi:hypothetical protein
MNIELNFEVRSSYLYAKAVGVFNLKEAMDCYRRILETAAQKNLLRILFDVCALTGDMTTMDRYVQSDFLAKEMTKQENPVSLKFAIVGNEPFLDPQRFGETVARNRGILLKVTTDINQALEWLGVKE